MGKARGAIDVPRQLRGSANVEFPQEIPQSSHVLSLQCVRLSTSSTQRLRCTVGTECTTACRHVSPRGGTTLRLRREVSLAVAIGDDDPRMGMGSLEAERG